MALRTEFSRLNTGQQGPLITKDWCWIKNPGKTWRKTVLNMVSAKGLWGAEGDLPSNGLQGKVT